MWLKKKTTSSERLKDYSVPISDENLNATQLIEFLSRNSDVISQQVLINHNEKISATLVYVDGMVQLSYLSDFILKPLLHDPVFSGVKNPEDIISIIESGAIYFPQHSSSDISDELITKIFSGQAALLFEQYGNSILFDVKGFDKRTIFETSSENIMKGAKDCFIETLNTNTAMVRRKIKTKQLVIENSTIGSQTLTDIAILYIEGTADDELVRKVKEKLNGLDIHGVLSLGVIEEAIVENPSSSFPQLMSTERTDKFCADVLEGRVGLIIDGFPVGYVLPSLFIQFLQAPEDYSFNTFLSSFVRCLRYIALILSITLPGFYIALTSFNPEMIPANLTLALAEYRTGVTFPTFIETILMLLAFEILLEAGNRMPKNIGQAISIVGALIIGEAAVNAKIVSPSVVIVVALTSISGLTVPKYGLGGALRIWRFIITISSSVLGLPGLVFSFIAFLFCLVKLENFGVPYMSPFVSKDGENMRDTFFRMPKNNFKEQTILGPSAKEVTSPYIAAIQTISLFDTFERIESLVVAIWIITDFAFIAALIFSGLHAFRGTFKCSDYRHYQHVYFLLIFFLSIFIANSAVETNEFGKNILKPGNNILCFGIPFILFLVGKVRKKI